MLSDSVVALFIGSLFFRIKIVILDNLKSIFVHNNNIKRTELFKLKQT